jgi:hypothetical protein
MQDNRIGCYFWLNNNRCVVVTVDSFGAFEHFAFRTVSDNEGNKPVSGYIMGWIPTAMVGQLELSL